jgi:plastocyanin
MSDRPAREPEGGRPSLPPVAYPILGLIFGGILVFSFSRVLLAVTRSTAPAIGLLMALNILVGAALVAYGGRVRRRPASFPLLVVGSVAVIGVGLFALNLESRPEEAKAGGPSPAVIKLVAKGTAFDKTELSFPAGAKVTIDFDNQDAGTPHNVAIFSKDNPNDVVFRGQLITGPTTATYTFTAPAQPGTFVFHCDVHPTQMHGTVTVTPGGGGGEGGGGAGGPPTIVAKGLAFQPSDLTVPGGGQITIHFDNQDPSTPHNIEVFNGDDASAPSLFKGDLVTGPAVKDYTFAAPPPGTYFFHCDIHPDQMKGTLTVT